jgi:hypothetical protein
VRESVAKKGSHYILEGRLTITHVDAAIVVADVRGHGQIHKTVWTSDAGWSCSCPARRHCAHIHAVQLVTVRERS